MSRRLSSTNRQASEGRARPSAAERVARTAVEFAAGRRNPFASVDLSRLSPQARAKAEAWQRERGFTPAV